MLANVLPGFRNIRTPLATGALYAVLLWLWVGRPAPATDSGWFADALKWAGLLGTATLVAAASIAAYLLGSVLTIDPVVSRTNPTRAVSRCWRFWWWCDIRHIYDTTEKQLMSLVQRRTAAAIAAGRSCPAYRDRVFEPQDGGAALVTYGRWMNHRCRAIHKCARRIPDASTGLSAEWIDLEDAAVGRLFAEVPILAVQLHAEQKDLYDDYDRALAEAGFRVSVLVPVVLVAFTVGFDGAVPPLWRVLAGAAGLVAFYALWTRSATKVRNANEIVVHALTLGIVRSPFLDHLDKLNAEWLAAAPEPGGGGDALRAASTCSGRVPDSPAARVN